MQGIHQAHSTASLECVHRFREQTAPESSIMPLLEDINVKTKLYTCSDGMYACMRWSIYMRVDVCITCLAEDATEE